MKPSSTENPVASTPNTPAARSPSWNRLPAGAERLTQSIAPTPSAATPTVTTKPMTRFMQPSGREGGEAL